MFVVFYTVILYICLFVTFSTFYWIYDTRSLECMYICMYSHCYIPICFSPQGAIGSTNTFCEQGQQM